MSRFPVNGAGLGLRRTLLGPLSSADPEKINFMEVAPENWMGVSGRLGKEFRKYTERFDFMFHGLSLSIGSPDPLDVEFVRQVKAFMDEHGVKGYSEHLSYCSSEGHMYDLMPIPFTAEAVKYVSSRIRQVQDIIEQPLIIENVSAYAQPGKEMEEIDFLNAVLAEADCRLLLDVNNVYVNSVNHGFDALNYLDQIPAERVSYIHIAGHYDEAEDLLVDTHGTKVKSDVWDLLRYTYQKHGVIPTLLERDFNLPPVEELMEEVDIIHSIQKEAQTRNEQQSA